MNYLVTGGAGFIGSNLTEELVLSNHKVIVVDNLSSGYLHNLPVSKNINFIKTRIQDLELETIADISGIFHLAAQVSVPKSIDDFYNSSSNNLLGTLRVFDLAKKLDIPVIYATSSAVYGNLPLGNDNCSVTEILSPYAQDKLSMEHYAKMIHAVFGVRSVGLRFFNVYGPRQDPSSPYSGVISIFIDSLMNKLPIIVNGGYQTRDFVYVRDVITTLLKSMSLAETTCVCEVINVGKGISISINQLVELLKKILITDPQITYAKLPFGDVDKSEGTFTRLKQVLKIDVDNFYSLEKGLIDTIDYIVAKYMTKFEYNS